MSHLSATHAIENLIFLSDQAPDMKAKSEIDAKIQSIAFDIIHNPTIDPSDRKEALTLLRRSITNTYRDQGAKLHINLLNRLSTPALPCTTYPGNDCDPFISQYGGGALNSLLARLSFHLCKSFIPKEIIDGITQGVHDDQIDVFLIIDNRFMAKSEYVSKDYFGHTYEKKTEELLVQFHRWIFPNLPIGSDVKKYPKVGVFPSIGFYQAQHWPAPINHFKEMEVYAHGERVMLYSPNGNHIAIDRAAPYGSCWIAARDGNRVCIAKVIKNIADYDTKETFPEFIPFFSLGNGCRNLDEFTQRLEHIAKDLDKACFKMFEPLALAISSLDKESEKELFPSLPSTIQQAIFKNLWMIKGSPHGIHNDFGRLSFEGCLSLAEAYRASIDEKIEAIKRTHDQIMNDLIQNPLELLLTKEDLDMPLKKEIDRSLQQAIEEKTKRLASVHQIIEEICHLIIHHADRDQKQKAIQKLDEQSQGMLKDYAMTSHKLFKIIYDEHIANKDDIENYKEPSHPNFGRAAFFEEEHQKTHPQIILNALAILGSELNAQEA
jgi:hypothetical protein